MPPVTPAFLEVDPSTGAIKSPGVLATLDARFPGRTVDNRMSGMQMFGPKAQTNTKVLRQPWSSKQEIRVTDGVGEAADHVAHVIVTEAFGSFTGDTGPSPRQVFGANFYTVTGKGLNDGADLNVLYGGLGEVSWRSPANGNLLIGWQAEASMSGDQAKGRVNQMRSLAIRPPNKKDGPAAEGSVGTAIGLYIGGLPLGKNQGNASSFADVTYAIFAAGGLYHFDGRMDLMPADATTAALVIKGFNGGGVGQTVAAVQLFDGTTTIKFLAGGAIAAKSNIVANEGGGAGVKIGNYGPSGEAAVQFGTPDGGGNLLTLYLSGGNLMSVYNGGTPKTITAV